MNPNFLVDNNPNNKLASPKPKQMNNTNQSNEIITNVEHINTQPSMDNSNYQSEIDDDTRYLMMLHKQIVPTPNLVS